MRCRRLQITSVFQKERQGASIDGPHSVYGHRELGPHPSPWPTDSCASPWDGFVLRELYNSTQGGPNGHWVAVCAQGWDTTNSSVEPCGQTGGPVWYGVTCNEQFRVVAIILSDCDLHGALPNSISTLSELTVL